MSFRRNVDIRLSTESLESAIREVREMRKELVQCCKDLVRALTDDGVTIAKMNVMSMNAVYTGALEESIRGIFRVSTGTGIIFTDVPYALYVEFGTGIVGEKNAHDGDTEIEWEYDIHDHGDSGWVYYSDTDGNKRFRWTKGMPARPYMYNTLRWLEQNAPVKAREIFRL